MPKAFQIVIVTARTASIYTILHKILIFRRTLHALRSPYGMSCPSVVCDVRGVARRFELFVNIFAPPYSSGTWAVCIKIVGKKSNGF